MSAKRRYSDEERANAMAALAANGGNVERTANELNIPRKTLANWACGKAHPEAAINGHEKKGPLADKLEEVARQMVGAIEGKIGRAPLNHLAVAIGIAIDKAQLLRGRPTVIVDEVSQLPDDKLDDELKDTERAILAFTPREAAQAISSN